MLLRVAIEKRLPQFTLDVTFEAGAAPLGILGASGSGKTLTLRAIAGLENPARGKIALNNRVLFDSAAKINLPSRVRRVGLVFQNYALFPHMTVAENIAFGLAHLPREEQRRIVDIQVARAHLARLEPRYLRELSGGQQQRVALARALATSPDVLLLDEPFSALDTHLRSQVEREFREALSEFRGVILLVSHNLEEVYRLCQNLLVLSAGKVAAFGSKGEIFRRPPSLIAAQLTGCKNFSRARALGEHCIEAVDWAVTLSVEQNLPNQLGHAGIRAHYIKFVGTPTGSSVNVFPCWVAAANESPFGTTLYLKLNSAPTDPTDYHLHAEVTKDVWSALAVQPQPCSIQLDPAQIFLLPD